MPGGLAGQGAYGGLAGISVSTPTASGRSVLGRTSTTTGPVTSIAATVDNTFLGRVGGVLAFAEVTHNIAANHIARGSGSGILQGSAELAYDSTQGRLGVAASLSGSTMTGLLVSNTSLTANSATLIRCDVAAAAAGDPMFSATISGGGSWTWGADNSVNDQWCLNPSNGTLGTGDVLQITTAGSATLAGALLDLVLSTSGAAVAVKARNASNTASSSAQVLSEVAGASAGDPSLRLSISGVTTWDVVAANASSDRLEVRPNGGSAVVTVLTSGEVGVGGAPVAAYALSVIGTSTLLGQIKTSASNALVDLEISTSSRGMTLACYGTGSGSTLHPSGGTGESKSDFCEIALNASVTRLGVVFGDTEKAVFDSTKGLAVVPTLIERAWVGGTLKTIQADVGNVGGGEDTLHTYTLPAAMLSVDGQSVEIVAMVTFAANANSKQARLYFGSTVIYDSTAQVQSGGALLIRAVIVRTGAATQRAIASGVADAAAPLFPDAASYTTPTETLSGTVVIKLTGAGTADNDIVSVVTKIRWDQAGN